MIRSLPVRLAVLSALLCATAGRPVFAQSTVNGSTPEPVLQEADESDRDFVRTLGQATANEGAIAAFALRTTKNATVQSLAQALRTDRRRTQSGLVEAASGAGFTPPDSPDAAERVLEHDLRAKSGAAFDHAFVERAIQEEQTTLDLLDREIGDGYNAHIVAFAKYRKGVIAAELGAAQAALHKLDG